MAVYSLPPSELQDAQEQLPMTLVMETETVVEAEVVETPLEAGAAVAVEEVDLVVDLVDEEDEEAAHEHEQGAQRVEPQAGAVASDAPGEPAAAEAEHPAVEAAAAEAAEAVGTALEEESAHDAAAEKSVPQQVGWKKPHPGQPMLAAA